MVKVMSLGIKLEVEEDLIMLDLMGHLRNLFVFGILLLEVSYERILTLMVISYGDDDEIFDDENVILDLENGNNVHGEI